ncbi:CoA transferase subunit A [Caproiciproducens sp. NJN-50]|nr:CoA transferase subunit A [Caproiciproducens sp. NJN-50]
MSKVMSAEEAVASFLRDGDCLAVGGFVTNRRPYALVREVIRQKKRNLYVEGGPSGGDIDMLIGAGCVEIIMVSYIANSGYTQVCRRFRDAVEHGKILFEDYSMDVQTIIYHGAALGLSYIPVKNMLGSDLAEKWGISREERKKHPKLPGEKFVVQEDPFHPGSKLCCVPTPEIDVALIHAQLASPDGTVRIVGAPFQDADIAMAAKHTIVSCEQLVSNEEIRRHPERNTLTGLCVDAVVEAPAGAHPSQCFGCYDYDSQFYLDYDRASRSQEDFDSFIREYVEDCPAHQDYLDKLGAGRLINLRVKPGLGYVPGLKRR